MTDTGSQAVLHLSPHPDDDVIPAGATLAMLADHGYRVVNLACSLGRAEHHQRRRAELQEAARRSGHELIVPNPIIGLSLADDLAAAEQQLTDLLLRLIPELNVVTVVGPHPHDKHHAHEAVGRATKRALEMIEHAPPWWAWGLWAELENFTLYVPFGDGYLSKVLHALEAYESENARNDYRRLVHGRAMANAVLGSERVFGFGSPAASPLPYAELLHERIYRNGAWQDGEPRILSFG